MVILVDLDSTVADLHTPWLAEYNADWDDNLTVSEILTFDWHKCVKPECGSKIYNYLNSYLFRNLQPLPGAISTVNRLRDDGHEIVFVTAAPEGTSEAKIWWVKDYFPWATKKDVIITHKKNLIRGDVLVDDSPENIVSYRKAWPNALIATISWPYNKGTHYFTDIYADSWEDTEKAWQTIYDGICELRDLRIKK